MIPFPPITFLRDLREECLVEHSEKRMPKWKFRLAPDLVLQLQPKPTYLPTPRQVELGTRIKLVRFDGVAVLIEPGAATAKMFDKLPCGQGITYWRRIFEVFANDENAWQFRVRSGCCTRGALNGFPAFDDRIATSFTDGFFTALTPEALLVHQCLICGKQLTDPASMARFIGPECAGTSSLTVPFLIHAA